MDWSKLYFGKLNKRYTLAVVTDEKWQSVRKSMKGKSLEDKYNILTAYLKENEFTDERNVHIRVTNYVTALSRGGLIKPSDYRK